MFAPWFPSNLLLKTWSTLTEWKKTYHRGRLFLLFSSRGSSPKTTRSRSSNLMTGLFCLSPTSAINTTSLCRLLHNNEEKKRFLSVASNKQLEREGKIHYRGGNDTISPPTVAATQEETLIKGGKWLFLWS